ncbi:MAG TPA: EscU/YscU/HrcU family type III secretion system export apparatus switch protein [Isosphaeraceae bacterium]|jgi:flagellar biosynthetic protein FlhB|nr:EscU/YscU/HrcU family type III secretion system export apparatus switch protein [Isosphaeraceae bacterium]
MPEERTQEPSKRRRQQARGQGFVARSGDLSTAAGLLAALGLLGLWGDDLATALIAAIRAPWVETPLLSLDAAEVVGRLRGLALGVGLPLLGIVGGSVLAAVAAHQGQVGGLFVPGLLAPDPARLWGGGSGTGLFSRMGRGAWSLAKAGVIVLVAAWTLRVSWSRMGALAGLDTPALARASASLLRAALWPLAAATLALGLLDYVLQSQRFEAMLRTTPEEHREDLRAVEGDPALRSRRRRLAESWRRDPAEALVGASFLLTGPAGLTLVLGGGPPPRLVTVLHVARGPSGSLLRRSSLRAGLPLIASPLLARSLSTRRPDGLTLPPDLAAELARVWPRERERSADNTDLNR